LINTVLQSYLISCILGGKNVSKKPQTIATGSVSPCWLATISPGAYELFKNCLHDACVTWIHNDWPRAADEEAMTSKLLTRVTSYVKSIIPQIQKEIAKPPLRGYFHFDYIESTKKQEHELGADFAILVELSWHHRIHAERFSLFQAKLFKHKSTTVKKEQLGKLRGFSDQSYYLFYNDKTRGPKAIPYAIPARNVEAILAGCKSKNTLYRPAVIPFALDFDIVLADHLISLWEGEDRIQSLNQILPIVKRLVPRLITIQIGSEEECYENE